MASRAILSNFFKDQRTQNHSQYVSGLSRTLFSDNLSRNSCMKMVFTPHVHALALVRIALN